MSNLRFNSEADLQRFLKTGSGHVRLKEENTGTASSRSKSAPQPVPEAPLPELGAVLGLAVDKDGQDTHGVRVGAMNKTELSFYNFIRHDPDVIFIRFDEISFWLGSNCRYHPDFFIIRKVEDGLQIEIHEVKGRDSKTGRWRAEEDATVKIKTFPLRWPFKFFIRWPLPMADGGGFACYEVPRH